MNTRTVVVKTNIEHMGDIEVTVECSRTDSLESIFYKRLWDSDVPGYLVLSDGTIFECAWRDDDTSCVTLKKIANGRNFVYQVSEDHFIVEAQEGLERNLPKVALYGDNIVTIVQKDLRDRLAKYVADFYII